MARPRGGIKVRRCVCDGPAVTTIQGRIAVKNEPGFFDRSKRFTAFHLQKPGFCRLTQEALMPESSMPQAGDKAPAFDLPVHPTGRVKLSQYKGKQNVVLYFYPKDDTPGCTTEACDFRDAMERLQSHDTVVLGVSADSVASHGKFAAKHSLPFPLLSDEDHAVCEKYGVWVEKNMYGRKSMGIQRATFLIDKSGKVAKVWPKVKVAGHVADVQAAIASLA